MIDRELLELAAKAAGYEVACMADDGRGLMLVGQQSAWNPLTDDSDALRLAVALKIEVMPGVWGLNRSDARNRHGEYFTEQADDFGGDVCAATRRAIVRAASEIGRVMP